MTTTAPLTGWSNAVPVFSVGRTKLTVTPPSGGVVLVQLSADGLTGWTNARNSPIAATGTFYVPTSYNYVRAMSASAVTEGSFDLEQDLFASQVPAAWQPEADGNYSLQIPNGAVLALYEPWTVARLTGTGNAATAACEYGGVKVIAVSSTVDLVLYDNTSAAGDIIDTISGLSLTGGPNGNGFYPWSSLNGARICGTGCHVVFSGGGSATIDVLRRLS